MSHLTARVEVGLVALTMHHHHVSLVVHHVLVVLVAVLLFQKRVVGPHLGLLVASVHHHCLLVRLVHITRWRLVLLLLRLVLLLLLVVHMVLLLLVLVKACRWLVGLQEMLANDGCRCRKRELHWPLVLLWHRVGGPILHLVLLVVRGREVNLILRAARRCAKGILLPRSRLLCVIRLEPCRILLKQPGTCARLV